MKRHALAIAAALSVAGLASPCLAGQVRLEIRGGLVTLEAKDATIREIFAEWSRVGKTRVVNAESVPGGPITVVLQGVPERQALEVLLRSVGGFLAVARTPEIESASTYDRIVVMPVARPVVAAASAGGRSVTNTQAPPSRDRIVIPPPPPADEDEDVQVMPMPGQGIYGGAQQPGMPTAVPFTVGGVQNPNVPQATQTPRPPPAAQSAPQPGMVTPPVIKPPGQPGEIK